MKYSYTLVRYEKNDRATEDWDKWIYPSFLCFDEKEQKPMWYGYTWDDLVSEKLVHTIICNEGKPEVPSTEDLHGIDDYDKYQKIWNERMEQYRMNLNCYRDNWQRQIQSYLAAGLLEKFWKNPKVENDVREYKYVLEGFAIEKRTIKELGIETEATSFQELNEEQWKIVEDKLRPNWEKTQEFFDKADSFIDLSGMYN